LFVLSAVSHASDNPVRSSIGPAVLQINHGPDCCREPADHGNLKDEADDEMKDSSS
jgi:hypothetical protein